MVEHICCHAKLHSQRTCSWNLYLVILTTSNGPILVKGGASNGGSLVKLTNVVSQASMVFPMVKLTQAGVRATAGFKNKISKGFVECGRCRREQVIRV